MALLLIILVTLAFLIPILTAGYDDRPNKNWW